MVEKTPAPAPVVGQGTSKVRITFAQRLLLVIFIFMGVIFQAAAVVLIVGMLPSIVAFMADRTYDKTRAFTITLLNFATCFYFLVIVTADMPQIEVAVHIVSTPLYIIVMYLGAATGYFLDWAMTGISNIVMTGRARARQEAIKKRQAELARRWGPEVTGSVPLDPEGYLIEPAKAG